MRLVIILSSVLLIVIFGPCIYLYVNRDHPVLYRYVDKASVEYSSFVILNAFRNRDPERQVENIFERIKNGDCQDALSLRDLDIERIAYLCERELKYRPRSWSVMDYQVTAADETGRLSDASGISLIYAVARRNEDGIDESKFPPVWISLVRIDDEWQVTHFDTYY